MSIRSLVAFKRRVSPLMKSSSPARSSEARSSTRKLCVQRARNAVIAVEVRTPPVAAVPKSSSTTGVSIPAGACGQPGVVGAALSCRTAPGGASSATQTVSCPSEEMRLTGPHSTVPPVCANSSPSATIAGVAPAGAAPIKTPATGAPDKDAPAGVQRAFAATVKSRP